MNRRHFAAAVGGLPLLAQTVKKSLPLDIKDYEPKSMLHVQETKVEKARFPVIDIHTHLSWPPVSTPAQLLEVMDRRNLRMLVNVTGGFGDTLKSNVQKFDRAHPQFGIVGSEKRICPGTYFKM